MNLRFEIPGTVDPPAARRYGLPVTEGIGVPHADAAGTTEAAIREVVVEFYQRARRDGQLGPVFDRHVDDWDAHLARMTDFWSAALLRTGRYSGRPVERHRSIDGLDAAHFDRWVELFEATVRDLCSPSEAEAFLVRARRMREGLIKALGLDDGPRAKTNAFEAIRLVLAKGHEVCGTHRVGGAMTVPDVIDVHAPQSGSGGATPGLLAKTGMLEVRRLALAKGREIATHQARGEITVHCLEGRIAFTARGTTHELGAGQMLVLAAGEPHSLVGLEDAAVLLTKVLVAGPPAP